MHGNGAAASGGAEPRVLLVAQQLGSTRSGVGTYVRSLLDELVARGESVGVATWDDELAPDAYPGLPAVGLGERPRWDRTPGAFVALGQRLAERLPESGVRAALLHFTDAREAFGFVSRTSRSDLPPMVGTIHDDYAATAPRSPFGLLGRAADPFTRWAYYRWLAGVERRVYRALSTCMANSDATGRSVSRRYGLDPARIRTVHLCLPKAAAPPRGALRLAGSPSLLFAGGNFYRKGLDTVVRALRAVAREAPDVHLHVAGEDRAAARIRRLTERLGVAARVGFLGRLPAEEMALAMASVDAFVMPSRTEALGLVYLEAMRAGTPVISGDVGGVTEIVRDGDSGLTVPPEDPEALASAVLRIHGDRELRARLARGGRAVLAERTPRRLADETLAVYADVLAT